MALTGCSANTEKLAEHFRMNQELYEQLKKEVNSSPGGAMMIGLLQDPNNASETAKKIIDQLPLRLNYIVSEVKVCDTIPTLQFELIFDPNIHLNYSECQPKNTSKLVNLEVIELNEYWQIWREKDFI